MHAFRHEKLQHRWEERLTPASGHHFMLQAGATPSGLDQHRRGDRGVRPGRLAAPLVAARYSRIQAGTRRPLQNRDRSFTVRFTK